MDKRVWFAGIFVLLVVILVLSGWDSNKITGEAKLLRDSPKTRCNDLIDNDGDGYCDFLTSKTSCRDGSKPGDPECMSKDDDDEAPPCTVTCKANEDCGTPGWSGEFYCENSKDRFGNYMTYKCNSPGSCSSSCSSETTKTFYEKCDVECLGNVCTVPGNETV